jgi:hypothetical protein
VISENTIEIEWRSIDTLMPYINNARTHSERHINQIAASIKEFGFTNPVLVDGDNGIIAGHGRVAAAQSLGLVNVPCLPIAYLTDAQKRAYIIADNQLALNAGWDDDLLKAELQDLQAIDFDMSLLGFDADFLDVLLEEESPPAEDDPLSGAGSLAARFMIPPFSVISAREGWWQNRKRAWLALGIESELGRDKVMSSMESAYKVKRMSDDKSLKKDEIDVPSWATTSIFDPVVCEIAYRWFSPVGGIVLDPFAGGSVRGVVASKLERQYIGGELRGEQVAGNREQGDALCAEDKYPPAWIEGDSRRIDETCRDVSADFVFSCPPYANLEVYSKDPRDISSMDYGEFKAAYFEIIKKSCSLLKPDRFACFVVGEVRDKKGHYYDFVGDTVQAFREAGLDYYNEIILVTQAGTLVIRAGAQFSKGRKIGKCHQNILVFVKGDSKKATAACGVVDVTESIAAYVDANGTEDDEL